MQLGEDSSDEEYNPLKPIDYSEMLLRKQRILKQITVHHKQQEQIKKSELEQEAKKQDLDISAEEAYLRRQSKSMLKAEAMMNKLGW